VHISTNAATGTDQDAATFWEKIRVEFVRRGGVNTQSGAFLQNRFNKVLQADINKFIGFFHASLREHHSGWSMADYVDDASKSFLLKSGKTLKHSLVNDIFPKYEVDLPSIDSRVWKAFIMCDDNEALGKSSGNTNTVDQHGLFVPPRPSIGKKKAKLILLAKKLAAAAAASVLALLL
jgi:hypothetical protein